MRKTLNKTHPLKVQSDVLSSFDREGSVVVLVMLDLSAAFYMIDTAFILRLHDMRLSGLTRSYRDIDMIDYNDILQRINMNPLETMDTQSFRRTLGALYD